MFLTCSTTTVSPVRSPTRSSFAFTISISSLESVMSALLPRERYVFSGGAYQSLPDVLVGQYRGTSHIILDAPFIAPLCDI